MVTGKYVTWGNSSDDSVESVIMLEHIVIACMQICSP